MSDLSPDQAFELLGKPHPVVLEIGANDGEDSARFVERGARLLAFEPDPRAAAKWRERIGERPNACLFEYAISNHDGTATFYQSGGQPPNRPDVDDWDKSGSLCKPTGHLSYSPWCHFDNEIVVCTSKLDSCTEHWGCPLIDLIWMDVQGAEGEVLKGGQETLPKVRWIYMECHDQILYDGQLTQTELEALIPGFKLHTKFSYNLLYERE